MFNTRKLKFQENMSGAQITCHAQPDNNMNPIIRTECMNNIPFFEEGAEYDNAKQKFAN